jgi:hypothetical protein
MNNLIKIIAIFVLATSFSFAAEENYQILGGSMHKSGTLVISSKVNAQDSHKINFTIDYSVKKNFFAPIPVKWLSGTYTASFSEEFVQEEFYMELERSKTREIDGMIIKHQGRQDYGRFLDCHKVTIEIIGGDVDVKITALYHPTIEHTGWAQVEVLVTKIPVLGKYRVKANILQ